MLTFWTTNTSLKFDPQLRYFNQKDIRIINSSTIPEIKKFDLLIVMGGANLTIMQDEGWLPKNRTIASLREKIYSYGQKSRKFMVTYSSSVKEVEYRLYVNYQIDMGLIRRYNDTGSLSPELGHYCWVKDYSHIPKIVNKEYNKNKKPIRVSLDLETVGLYPFINDKFIVSISVSFEEGSSELIRFKSIKDQPKKGSKLWDQIRWILNDDRISLVGANLKFDLLWIRVKWGILCTNFKLDTTLVGSLLDENRSNSLNTHCKIYAETLSGYDDFLNKEYDKGRMDLIPDNHLLPYAGGDTDATLRVCNELVKDLVVNNRQVNFYTKLLHPASRAFEDMEYTGVCIDVPYFKKLKIDLEKQKQELSDQAKKLMPARIVNKYKENFKLSRDVIIKDYMFSHKKGLKLKPKLLTEKTQQPSTAFKHLKMFEDVKEAKQFIDILKDWTSAQKTLSTYVVGFMKHLRDDNKLHPTAILYKGDFEGSESGTNTGRLSFKNPAAQTNPKHTKWAKPLRKGYICPDDFVIINWDYSQGELRVMACIANERNMIQAYVDGIDLHLKTGSELNGYTLEQGILMKKNKDPKIIEIRQGGKAGNFGLIYGISPEGYVTYARDTYGVVLSLKESNKQKDQFFQMYPALVDYHQEYKEKAKIQGYVTSPLGRVRHLPMINSRNWGNKGKAERQAINAPVQSTLSDLSELALSEFKKVYGYHPNCRFFLMTHDSLTAYVRKDEVDFWVPEVTSIMENLPLEEYFDWKPQLKFLVDSEMGYNLGSMVDLGDYPDNNPSEVLNYLER